MKLSTMFFVVFWVFFFDFSICQVTDDFTDGEIHTNPVWSGDTSFYWVVDPGNSGDGSLASGANDDGKVLCSKPNQNDAVITTISTIANGEWIFSVADGAGWSLSGTNDYNIILISDETDILKLTDGSFDFNGYFLHRGCSSCDDVFELYRQDGTSSTLILNTNYPASPDGSGAENGHTVKIIRDNSGIWEIYIDDSFDTIPATLRGAPVLDTTHTISSCFAISTNISNASGKRVLYFDNLSINDNNTVNVLPPSGLVINYIAPDKLNLVWTKPGGTYGTDWDGVVVFAREGAPNDADLSNSDAVDFLPNLQYAAGTQSNNSFCVVNQNSDSDGDVVVSGLSGGESYFFVAYAYLENAGDDNDDWSMAATEVGDTTEVQGVSGFCSYSGEASALLRWTNYTVIPGTWWSEVMIVGKPGSAVDHSPFGDGSNYLANQQFGLGTELGGQGTDNFVVYKGVEDSVFVFDLVDDSVYYFRAFVRYDTLWTLAGEYRDTMAIPSSERLFISEISDPLNNVNARFVEIYNAGDVTVDMSSASWHLCKQTNGGSWNDLLLTGKIYPGCTYVISYNVSDFVNSHFFQPDQASSVVSGNGDDGYFLYKNGDHISGKLIDSYGIVDQNGSGTLWEYTDSRVARKDTISSANTSWIVNEWLIIPQAPTTDMEPGRHKSGIRWQGSVSGNWNDGSNWTGGNIPDTSTLVYIPNTGFSPEVSGSSVCYNLRMSPLGKLNINSGGSLNVSEDVLLNADQSGAASIITEGSNDLQYGGQLSIVRYFSSNEKWHYVSSPLSDCIASVFTGCYLNSWNETLQLWEHILDPASSLDITEGYSVNPPASFGTTANFTSFSGSLNAGNYNTKPLTYTQGQDSTLDGYNFIGNPYPSSVNWDLVNIPASIDAAIYYWDPSAGIEGMYKSYVPGIGGSGSCYIPPMHGFFIHASNTVNGEVISFDNSVRTHIGQTTIYKKGSYKDLLKFDVCGNGYCDATYLKFSSLATAGFDGKYDAYKLFTTDTLVPQIFSRISNAELSVNSMPLPQSGVIIPLGFKSGTPGNFTINIDLVSIFNPQNSIILKDLLTGFSTNLLKNSNYTFFYQPGDDQNRFLLYINYALTDKSKNPVSSGISILSTEKQIIVNSSTTDKIISIEILNLLGQRIATMNAIEYSTNVFDIEETSGIYLVRVICRDGIVVQKILVP